MPRLLLRVSRFLLACLGLFVLAVTLLVPLLHQWTTALSTPWGDLNGDILIVLGGDDPAPDIIGQSSYWRSFYAVRTWRAGHFRRIVVSGQGSGFLMRDFLASQGVPWQAIWLENAATSTHENALFVANILRGDNNRKVLLTSDFHMRRALGAFCKAGIEAQPFAIPDAHKRLSDWTQRWSIFWMLAGETVKLIYYQAHGWI